MKLSSRYIPYQHEKKGNKLFQLFENELMYAFSNPLTRDRSRESVKDDRYRYIQSDLEKDYYETFYIDLGNVPGTEESEIAIDENSQKIINFILQEKCNILSLIAPVGWGKTMLLGYVFDHLIPTREEYKTILPIYFFMDKHTNTLEVNSPVPIVKLLRKDIFPNRLIRLLESYYDLDDEELWSYIKTHADQFGKLAKKERNYHKRYADNPKKMQKKSGELVIKPKIKMISHLQS